MKNKLSISCRQGIISDIKCQRYNIVLSSSYSIAHWTIHKLPGLDRLTRMTMADYPAHHPSPSVNYLYMSISSRGLCIFAHIYLSDDPLDEGFVLLDGALMGVNLALVLYKSTSGSMYFLVNHCIMCAHRWTEQQCPQRICLDDVDRYEKWDRRFSVCSL